MFLCFRELIGLPAGGFEDLLRLVLDRRRFDPDELSLVPRRLEHQVRLLLGRVRSRGTHLGCFELGRCGVAQVLGFSRRGLEDLGCVRLDDLGLLDLLAGRGCLLPHACHVGHGGSPHLGCLLAHPCDLVPGGLPPGGKLLVERQLRVRQLRVHGCSDVCDLRVEVGSPLCDLGLCLCELRHHSLGVDPCCICEKLGVRHQGLGRGSGLLEFGSSERAIGLCLVLQGLCIAPEGVHRPRPLLHDGDLVLGILDEGCDLFTGRRDRGMALALGEHDGLLRSDDLQLELGHRCFRIALGDLDDRLCLCLEP